MRRPDYKDVLIMRRPDYEGVLITKVSSLRIYMRKKEKQMYTSKSEH